MSERLPFTLVNAFAQTPHSGNPAAIVLFPGGDARASDEEYMRALAHDFNLSETVFLVPIADGPVPHYAIRWFSPTVEVPLCGHGTLAAATALTRVHTDAAWFKFTTRTRGDLAATVESERGARVPRIALNFPILPATPVDGVVDEIAQISGFAAGDVVRTAQFGDYSIIVELAAGVDLGALTVEAGKFLETFPHHVVLTQILPADLPAGEVRATARVFAPAHGVDEDPVTGAVWAVLTGYYLQGLGRASVDAVAPAASVLDAYQLSARGGQLVCSVDEGRAKIVGRGWCTGTGTLEVFTDADSL